MYPLEVYGDYDSDRDSKDTIVCYGVIIPIKKETYHLGIQSSISNLINDLLRMNISVYWSLRNFNSTSIMVNENSYKTRFFERGSFIVPFTGEESKDKMIISIVHDYEYRSEIEIFFPVELYYITEPISLDVYPLNYPRCAYHFGEAVSYFLLSSYLDLLLSGGFFDNQLLLDNEISDRLDNKNFDIFIWPGANTARGVISPIKTGLHLKASETIRRFVRNGGGYIGSCYGATSASSGIFLPFTLPGYYRKDLPVTLFLSLLPTIVLPLPFKGDVSVKIEDTDNPITFGLKNVERSWFGEGPIFLWMGKEVETLGVLNSTEINWNLKSQNGFISKMIKRWVNFGIGKPIWVTSRFGKGKIVVFGDHPELLEPENNARLIYNTILYISASDEKLVYTPYYHSFQWIKSISRVTNDIPLKNHTIILKTIWYNYSILYNLSSRLDAIRDEILDEAYLLLEKNRIDSYIYFLLHSEYRDSYQRWLESFSHCLEKLERILATTSYTDINLWRWNTNNLLDNGISRFKNLLDQSIILLYKMRNFIETSKEKIDLVSLAGVTDKELRDLRNIFIELVQSTFKLYRSIWYNYETTYQPDVIGGSLDINISSFKSHNIIYVDDNAEGIGNGSIESPFKKIQDAVDFSSNGDTILIRKGIYHENIIIPKSIILVGEDRNSTIIDAMRKPRHVVIVVASNVEIRNLTIQNSSIEAFSSGILLQSSNNLVSGNILRENRIGIGFRPWSQNNIIENNILVDNRFAGIAIDEINNFNNTITGNVFSNNSYRGLFLYNIPAKINNNSFRDDGIYIIPSEDTLKQGFYNNTIDDTPIIYLKDKDNLILENISGQIIISNSHNIVIKNSFIRKTGEGILISRSDNITILNSSLEENLVGIKIFSSNNIKIYNANISNSYNIGIWVDSSKHLDIIGDSFYENREGLLLLNSDRNLIKENVFYNNNISIYLSSSRLNNIEDNTFKDNGIDVFNKWL